MAITTINPEDFINNSKSAFFCVVLYGTNNQPLFWRGVGFSTLKADGITPFRKEEAAQQYYAASRHAKNMEYEGDLQFMELPPMRDH